MIINQTGGGKKPTGTKYITTNGVHDVTDYASADVNVPTTAPSEPYAQYKIVGGELVGDNSTSRVINLTGVTTIKYPYLAHLYEGNTNIAIANLHDVQQISSTTYTQGPCLAAFRNSSITSVDFSSLQDVGAYYGCSQMFYGCTGLTSISFPSLTQLTGNGAFDNLFYNCSNLTNIGFPVLNYLGSGGSQFKYAFYGCSALETIAFDALQKIDGNYAFQYAFFNCSGLKNISFKNLESIIAIQCFNNCFANCMLLTELKWQSLKEIKSNVFYMMMARGLTNIYFYALDTDSFGGSNNRFNNMLVNTSGCTVHFPIRIQSTIGSWPDVLSGFGGTNTTVLFDIVTTLVGADTNSYTRQEKDSTVSATAWTYNSTLYYTSGNTEPVVGDTIYSDAACTTAVTTVSSLS